MFAVSDPGCSVSLIRHFDSRGGWIFRGHVAIPLPCTVLEALFSLVHVAGVLDESVRIPCAAHSIAKTGIATAFFVHYFKDAAGHAQRHRGLPRDGVVVKET